MAYVRAMRNPLPAGAIGACSTCRTFIPPQYDRCFPCSQTPQHLDAVAPITYSENLGQMHTALRSYKDGPTEARAYALPRLAAILWRFLDDHETCVARATGVDGFDLVTTVPSSTPSRDDARSALRDLVGLARPAAGRFERILRATGEVQDGRAYSPRRYTATGRIDGRRVLLVDDTWTTGGHAQSAAYALLNGGAEHVALVVIGRHLRPEWEVVPGTTSGELFNELPTPFSWETCSVHL